MVEEITPVEAARSELHTLAEALGAVRLPLEAGNDGRDLVAELTWTIRGYLVPRLGDPGAPLVVVLIGSTGSGKSTLLNSIAGGRVSDTSVVRPTTTRPVIWCHVDNAPRYENGPLADLDPLVVGARDPLLDHLTIVDAPDIDSVELSHRAIADALLRAADVCLFVTTPQRYADSIPWEFLHHAHRRDVPIMYVMNRTRDEITTTIIRDFVSRMQVGGFTVDIDEVIPVREQSTDPTDGGLDDGIILHLRSILGEMAVVDPDLTVSQATLGALDDLILGLDDVMEAARRDEAILSRLRLGSRQAYAFHRDQIEGSLAAGTLIKGEILGHWSDLVGGGQFSQAVNRGLEKVRSWRRRTLGGEASRVEGEARGEVAAIIYRRIDLAAADAAANWHLDPVGREALDHPLWRIGDRTGSLVQRSLEDWTGEVRRLVVEKGGDRSATARAASIGVNALAVVAILAVFSQSGGLTGAEVGIAAGAAAAQQAILEKIFGGAAMRTLVGAAREGLVATVDHCFEVDRARFEAPLARLEPEGIEALPGHRRRLAELREKLRG